MISRALSSILNRVIVGNCAHGRGNAVKDAFRVIRHMIGYTVRRFRADDKDGAVFRVVAVFHMLGRPRTGFFIFGNAECVLSGVTEGAFIEISGLAAAYI